MSTKTIILLFIGVFTTLCANPITSPMTTPLIASGTFDIKVQPCEDSEFQAGRLTIDKIYYGSLAGTGKGQMLSVRTANPGSAGYVAMELVEATLDGKTGSFALQHTGLMSRGESSLTVVIVPDSGTGELKGIAGAMTIDQSSGGHRFELSYTIEPSAK
jgi:hypothetical protein|tara:strand:+ start:639 stop:1115 length:477 start_codon:yes stop_codon:yes gene_type:complete